MSKKKIFIITLCVLITLSFIISYYFFSLTPYDNFFYNLIISLKSSITTEIFKVFTYIGGVISTIILIIIMLGIDRKKGIYFLINILVIITLNFILKNIFMRSRPIDINIITETGYSFPSGHTMTAVAAYGLIIYYLYRSNLKKYFRNILVILSLLLAVIIPISRVYLGVHYFSDITVGACISIIWLMIYTEYLKKKNI